MSKFGGVGQNWHLLRFNPLNADLNHICHLLALLGAHHIFHVSGLRVNPFLNTTIEIFKNILHSLSHISRSFGLPCRRHFVHRLTRDHSR